MTFEPQRLTFIVRAFKWKLSSFNPLKDELNLFFIKKNKSIAIAKDNIKMSLSTMSVDTPSFSMASICQCFQDRIPAYVKFGTVVYCEIYKGIATA